MRSHLKKDIYSCQMRLLWGTTYIDALSKNKSIHSQVLCVKDVPHLDTQHIYLPPTNILVRQPWWRTKNNFPSM